MNKTSLAATSNTNRSLRDLRGRNLTSDQADARMRRRVARQSASDSNPGLKAASIAPLGKAAGGLETVTHVVIENLPMPDDATPLRTRIGISSR